jgi:hypothetical protein
MLGFFKDSYNYVTEKASNGFGYVADKALDLKDAASEIRMTRGEKIGVTVGAVSAWPLFSLAFGSAPLTLFTVLATPAATTALIGAGYFAAKGVKYFMDNNRWTSDYAPEYGPDVPEDHEIDSDAEDENDVDLYAEMANNTARSYTHRTLLRPFGGREVEYTLPAMNRDEVDAMQYGTSRSGKSFRK